MDNETAQVSCCCL